MANDRAEIGIAEAELGLSGSRAQAADYQSYITGTSPVVQWLRMRLPMQGTQV